ncbi:MAG: glycine cleavage system protein T [Rhodospirillaceae bacterium]|nr:glycine cleavage system protein T [Rhodospirillaceae bacterium]
MLKHTALYDLHQEREAKLAPFAGFDMPLYYHSGALKEHLFCREKAAIFDVSHMGQIEIKNPSVPADSAAKTILSGLEQLIPADLLSLPAGRQRYGLLLTPEGGIADDLMVMHMGDHIRLVVNSACVEKDINYLRSHFENRLPLSLMQLPRALVAVQGPMAEAVMSELFAGLGDLSFMHLRHFSFDGHEVQISRSGYTGEDGFEVSLPNVSARLFVEAVCATGQAELAGLVARDSLRLEAGLCLYGQDMDESVSVMDAGLGWAVGRARRSGGVREGGFQGAERTLAEFKGGAAWKRVGARSHTNRPVRTGAQIFVEETATKAIGSVTSGSPAPSAGCPVVMMRLKGTHQISSGDVVWADVRGRRIALTICDMPFFAHRFKR